MKPSVIKYLVATMHNDGHYYYVEVEFEFLALIAYNYQYAKKQGWIRDWIYL